MDSLPASMKTARIPLYDVFMMYCVEILSFQTISLLISAQFDAMHCHLVQTIYTAVAEFGT